MLKDGAIEAIVVGLHLRWNGVWQRPNHVVTRLCRSTPVFVVEEPLTSEADSDVITEHDGLAVLTPHRRVSTDAIDARAIETARAWIGARRPLIWLYTPMMLPLATAISEAPLIYDKMDHLAAFLNADERLEARENGTLERAAVVFAGGASLWETVQRRARRGLALPSGVDIAHFAGASTTRPHEALRCLRRPLFGYVGVIDERLDLTLIAGLADARPEATLVLVGPVAKISADSLPRRPNIVYLGQRSYAELPALIGAFDVALMPFALGTATEYISPTKTLEYLVAGRPVVSTAVRDVVSAFGDVVRIAESPAAFVAAVAEAERTPLGQAGALRERFRAMTWDGIVTRMLAELDAAGIVMASRALPIGLST